MIVNSPYGNEHFEEWIQRLQAGDCIVFFIEYEDKQKIKGFACKITEGKCDVLQADDNWIEISVEMLHLFFSGCYADKITKEQMVLLVM